MFREDKATQMAARFLSLAGGSMDYVKLLKLMYLADKQMLLERNRPIVYDAWVSMRFGPVLSQVYNMIRTPNTGTWSKHIRTAGSCVALTADPGGDGLSRAEDDVVDSVFVKHGHKDRWDLERESHEFNEWDDPGDLEYPISYENVLAAEGFPAEIIPKILEAIAEQDRVERVLVA